MIAAVIGLGEVSLAIHSPPEFSTPDNQRVVQQPSLLQVRDERSRRLVGSFALQRNIAGKIIVLVPPAMVELNEPHAALGQTPRHAGSWRRMCRVCANPARTARMCSRALSTSPSDRGRRTASGTPSRTA